MSFPLPFVCLQFIKRVPVYRSRVISVLNLRQTEVPGVPTDTTVKLTDRSDITPYYIYLLPIPSSNFKQEFSLHLYILNELKRVDVTRLDILPQLLSRTEYSNDSPKIYPIEPPT